MATKPATRTPPKSAHRTAPVTSKAQQAAQHQGRRPEPASARRDPPPPQPRAQVPARRPNVAPPATDDQLRNVPAFMRGDLGAGKENIGNEDLEIPRLKLIQGLSPELQDYNDLRAGDFLHTASETIFSKDETFRAVPIYMERQYILWRPRDMGGGILARAPDGIHWSPAEGEFEVTLDKKDGGNKVTWRLAKTVQQSGLANWGTMNPDDPNSPPAATLMYNFVLAFPDLPDLMPAVITYQRSSIKMGRKFNTKLKTVRTPLFGQVFEFSSFSDSNTRGQDFFNINTRGAGLVEDEDQYNTFKSMYENFSKIGLNIKDVDTLQTEEGDNADEQDGAAKY